jgi:hypothetical protein
MEVGGVVVVGGEVSSVGREGEGVATGVGSGGGARWDAASRRLMEKARWLRGREACGGEPAVK